MTGVTLTIRISRGSGLAVVAHDVVQELAGTPFRTGVQDCQPLKWPNRSEEAAMRSLGLFAVRALPIVLDLAAGQFDQVV